MKRAIIVPAALSGAPLAELKAWLGIRLSEEDQALTTLLRASLETCEAFTGQMPLEAECEEILPQASTWMWLATRPVQAISAVDGIAADGTRTPVEAENYEIELDADGGACVRAAIYPAANRIAVRFTAGIAPGWASLPEGLKHGVLRLAAHNYRQRDREAALTTPPAAVTALWQPWRRMRLA